MIMFSGSRYYRQLRTGISCLCILVILSSLGVAQTQSPAASQGTTQLSAKAAKAKQQLEKIGPGNDVGVIRNDGKAFHGSIFKITADTVFLNEVDLKSTVEIPLEQVKKVEKGYSPANKLTGQRPSPKVQKGIMIGALAALGVCAVLIITALAND